MMAAALSSRHPSCFDDPSRWRIKARKTRAKSQDGMTRSNVRDGAYKLQELKLAFCLLSREIQGLDKGGGQVPATATPSATPGSNTGDSPVPRRPTGLSQPSAKDYSRLEKKAVDCPSGGDVALVASHDGRTEMARAENRKAQAAEVAAKQAKQALKKLQAELDAERRSRMGAESALQQLQLQAAESALEREKLVRVVNSFGGRSLEELTAGSQLLEHRLREAESALAKAQQAAAEKAAEAAEALEQAASFAEALERERSARIVAEEGRKNATQQLRCCLRGRAKAEEEARHADAALRKSQAQRESLAQRLEVLRMTNKRLDKKAASAAHSVSAGAGMTGSTVARLATARARLKNLSAADFHDSTGTANTAVREGYGEPHSSRKERAALERAVSTAVADKRWREKLREAETQGEVHQSAAKAAEIGLKLAVRQKAELQEINRILAKKLAGDKKPPGVESDLEHIDWRDTDEDNELIPSGVVGDGQDSQHKRKSMDGACAASSLSMHEDNENGACATERCCSEVPSSPLDRAHELSAASDTTRPPGEREALTCASGDKTTSASGTIQSGGTRCARSCSRLGEVEQQKIPSSPMGVNEASQTKRSNSADERVTSKTTSPSLVETRGYDHCSRPRSASANEAMISSALSRGKITATTARRGQEQPRIQSNLSTPPPEQQQQQQQQQQGKAEETITEGSCCCGSATPFNRLLSESRQLRDEVLSAVRNSSLECDQNMPQIDGYARDAQGLRGGGGGGVSGGTSYVPQFGERATREAVTPVPIEVLLRLCDRGARGALSEKGVAVSGAVAAENTNGARGTSTAGNQYLDCARVAEDKNYDILAREARSGKSTPADGTRSEATPLPPGVTPALAQKVQAAVSRGDERGFLRIVERCGSTAREGIAQLLAIDAPEK